MFEVQWKLPYMLRLLIQPLFFLALVLASTVARYLYDSALPQLYINFSFASCSGELV